MSATTWTGTGGASWFDPAAWSNGLPVAGGQAAIGSGGPSLTAADASQVPATTVSLDASGDDPIAGIDLDGGSFGADGGLAIHVAGAYGQLYLRSSTIFSGTLTETNPAPNAPDFARIKAAQGAALTIAATGEIESGANGAFYVLLGDDQLGSLVNDGTLAAAGGLFYANGATITGTGAISISANGSFDAFGSIGSGQTVAFGTGGGSLLVGPTDLAGTIQSLGPGDVLDLYGLLDGATYDAATGQMTLSEGGQTVATIAIGALVGADAVPHLVRGNGEDTLLVTSDAQRVFAGGSSSWFDPAAWQSGVPQAGDTVTIGSGTVTVSGADELAQGLVDVETISLGGGATLEADNATFGANADLSLAQAGGTATLAAHGTATLLGSLSAIGQQAALTVAVSADSTLTLGSGADLVVGAESNVNLTGAGTLVDTGLIVVSGHFVVATGSTLDGGGTVRIQRGGSVDLQGSVSDLNLLFGDDSGSLTIDSLANFNAYVGSFGNGNRLDIAGQIITRVDYDVGTSELALYDGTTDLGAIYLGLDDTLPVGGSTGFSLSADGAGGTNIRYTPTVTALQPMLPVPVVAAPGAAVSLPQILDQAFGGTPAGGTTFGLSSLSATDLNAYVWSYWNLNKISVSGWSVNGKAVPPLPENTNMPPVPTVEVDASTLGTVSFTAGNQIAPSVYLEQQTGTTTQTTWYMQTIDPAVLGPNAYTGRVDPADIIASAETFANYYGVVPNSNDCEFIGDAVAAAAGATMPWLDGATDPDSNVSGGFWRVVYRGSDVTDPVQNWSTLVQPGDIVRMGWDNGGQHTTTVLSKNADGTITVYDNDDPIAGGYTGIGIHEATYWLDTVPSSITIYRLDSNHQYLVQGGSGSAAALQGSVYDNLMQPGHAGDTIAAGAADNWVQGTARQLDRMVWTDLHLGDVIDVQDLAVGSATPVWNAASAQLSLVAGGTTLAMFDLVGLNESVSFASFADGSGGSAIVPVPVTLSAYAGAASAALLSALAPLARAGVSTNVSSAANLPLPLAGEVNIGVVAASSGATYDAAALAGAGEAYQGIILSGQGAATVLGGASGTLLVGNAAPSTLVAGEAAATLISGGNGSTLFGQGGDTLVAGPGNGTDTLVGGALGAGDTLLGGAAAAVFAVGAAGGYVAPGSGGGTVLGGAGGTIVATQGGTDVFLGSGVSTVLSGGADRIVGGAGAVTVSATGGTLVYGGSGTLAFVGGAAADTVVGGTGGATLFGGVGGGTLYAGAAENAILVGTSAATTLVGGDGSRVFAARTGGVLVAGAGNETLVGGSDGPTTFFAGSGQAVMGFGNGGEVFQAGDGQAVMVGGAGADLFRFTDGYAGGTDTVVGFEQASGDRLVLQGYGAGAEAAAIASQQSVDGCAVLSLPDSTRITLPGIAAVGAASFA